MAAIGMYLGYLIGGGCTAYKAIKNFPIYPTPDVDKGPSKRHMQRSQKEGVYVQGKTCTYEKGVYRVCMSRPIERGIET